VWFCDVCGSEIDLRWPLRYLAAWIRARVGAVVRRALEGLAAEFAWPPLPAPGVSAVDHLRDRMILPAFGDLELDAIGDLTPATPRRWADTRSSPLEAICAEIRRSRNVTRSPT
jgi:hypothetical protein